MRQNFLDSSCFIDTDKLNSSISKISISTFKRSKYTTLTEKQKPNHQKQIFKLPQTIEKSFETIQPSQSYLTRNILETIKYSLNQIQVLKKSYSNISDERKKYKDIIEWLKYMLVEFNNKYKMECGREDKDMTAGSVNGSIHRYISQLHNIFSSAIHQLIKELKEQNLQKACLIRISWESMINFHNSSTKEFSRQLEDQKKQINTKHKQQQVLYDKQILELEAKLQKTILQLAKREKYFYEVVKDNRVMRRRINKLMDQIQMEVENSSYIKEQNLTFYKQNQKLKLVLETEMIEEKYKQVLLKLDNIQKQFIKNKKKKNSKENQKQAKQLLNKQLKNKNIIEKQINEIIKRVNANDFLDLDMATLPSSQDLGRLFHGIGIQTQPFVESIGINTYMNMVKRSVGTQHFGERKKLSIAQQIHIIIQPMMLQLKSGELNQYKKNSDNNSSSDRNKNRKRHKDSIPNSYHRPSDYIDPKSIKQNTRNLSSHNDKNKKFQRISLAKNILPNINNKQKLIESSDARYSAVIHPLSNLVKSNMDFMRSSVNEKKDRDLRKSSFIMKNITNKLERNRNKNEESEYEEENTVNNLDEKELVDDINEKDISKIKIENIEEEEHQSDEAEQFPVIKKTHSTQHTVLQNKNKKQKDKKDNRFSKTKYARVESISTDKILKEAQNQQSSNNSKLSEHPSLNNLSKIESNFSNQSMIKGKIVQESKITTPRESQFAEERDAESGLVVEKEQQVNNLKNIFKSQSQSNTLKNNSKTKIKNKIKTKTIKQPQKKSTLKRTSATHADTFNLTSTQEASLPTKQKSFEGSQTLYPLSKVSALPEDTAPVTIPTHSRHTSILSSKPQRSNTQFKSVSQKQPNKSPQNDKFSQNNILKIFKKVNQQILTHKNNLLKQQISFQQFLQMNMVRNYGLKNITLEIKQKLKNSLNKYKGSDLMMQVFKKLVQNQQTNPLAVSLHYKRHIFRVYILILQFWDNYSNLQNFQSLCQAFMKDLISSFFNKSKTDKILTFFEMIEINNEYKMFSIMENVIETESQSLAFMNTIYNLQSVLSDRHSISMKEMTEILRVVERNRYEMHCKINQIFKYSSKGININGATSMSTNNNTSTIAKTKAKTLPYFNLILQLNKNNESSIINIQTTIEDQYNLRYHNKYPTDNLQQQLKIIENKIPRSRFLRILQCMETETLRQSQKLIYQLIKLEFSNGIIEECWQDMMGEDLMVLDELVLQGLTSQLMTI